MKWAVQSFALLVACAAAGASAAQAATVSYTIIPELSSLKMTGDVIGAPIGPQAPGADVAYFQGSITGDLNAGVLTFGGGSVIDAMLNPAGPFVPNTVGLEDNYGMTNGQVAVTFRDVVMDISAGTVQDGAAPAAMDLPVTFVIDSLLQAGAGDDDSPNTTAALASLSTSGSVETLTMPIYRESGAGGPLHIVIAGQLVASRTIPEPSTLALTLLGGLAGLGTIWRRRR